MKNINNVLRTELKRRKAERKAIHDHQVDPTRPKPNLPYGKNAKHLECCFKAYPQLGGLSPAQLSQAELRKRLGLD